MPQVIVTVNEPWPVYDFDVPDELLPNDTGAKVHVSEGTFQHWQEVTRQYALIQKQMQALYEAYGPEEHT